MIPCCLIFRKPCKVQFLGSDATAVISAKKKKGKVFSRLFGMELTQQVGGTSTEDGMVLVNLVLMFLCHSRLLEMLGNFSKDYFFAVLQMFPAQETCDMTTDFQETITVLPLGLTSALSLVVSWVEVF